MQRWSLLSTHGQALLCIYRDPTVRLRDIATDLAIVAESRPWARCSPSSPARARTLGGAG
jgi:hypothetical protein